MLGFNAEVSDEPIQGRPKFIRTVMSDVVVETDFDPQGKLIERRAFRPDGSLTYRTTYEAQTSITLDGTGTQVSSTERTLTESGWRELTIAADGKHHTQIAQVDGEGRVLESKSFGPSDEAEITYHAIFDEQGNFIGADVQLNQTTVETRQNGNRTTMVSFGSDRAMLSRTETSRVGDVGTCLMTLPIQLLKTGRVDQRDSIGNWISKTLFESNSPDEIGEAVSTIERTITYW